MSESSQPIDSISLVAFFLVVLLGGSNSVAIRFSNRELAPFWGAFLRFAGAALICWVILFVRKLKLPGMRDVLILAFVGFLATGVSFALLYWALQTTVPVAFATLIMSTSPLFTLILAILHRIERFRIQSLVGGVVAFAGLILSVNAQPGGSLLLPAILALIVGSLFAAEANVILKMQSFKSDPVIVNTLTFTSGAVFLGAASFIARESWLLPVNPQTWMALLYLIFGGSVLMFYLFIFVLNRWKASSASSAVLFFPLVATTLAAVLAGEQVTFAFVVGGLIVIAGVWLGAFYRKTGA